MAISATDIVTIVRTDASKGVRVEVNFADANTGEDKGTFGYEWPTMGDFDAFLAEGESEEQTMRRLLRTALAANYDAKAKVIDEAALLGKSFSVDAKPVLTDTATGIVVGITGVKP